MTRHESFSLIYLLLLCVKEGVSQHCNMSIIVQHEVHIRKRWDVRLA